MLDTHVAWLCFNFNQGSNHLAIFEAHVVLFELEWLGRPQRGKTTFQDRYSGHLCGISFHTLVLEYDMRLAIQCSFILAMQCSTNSFESRLSNANCLDRHQ